MKSKRVEKQRNQLLRRFENFFEIPMIVLGFVWLTLLIVELVYKTGPVLEKLTFIVWGIFIVDFMVKFTLAPGKLKFLKANILTLISLVIPAFRVVRIFRIIRLLRFSRGIRLVKVLGSLNRGIRILSATMQRRAFGYVLTLTVIVLFVGAAGMFAFEKEEGLRDYSTALWWTTMLLTTMGSEYWPRTTEGRILCVMLSVYAFTMFGYVTATIATFFIGRDAEDKAAEAGAVQRDELKQEIRELKTLLGKMLKQP